MSNRVVVITPNGPFGLSKVGYSLPDSVVAGLPVEWAHVFHTGPDGRFIVGVWESDPGTLRYESYPFDEFCLILDGSLELTPDDGPACRFGSGDAFVIPKGFRGVWHMPGKLRKYYVEGHS